MKITLKDSIRIYILFFVINNLVGQTNAFSVVSSPSSPTNTQQKMITYTSNTPHIDSLSFISWNTGSLVDTNGNMSLIIPNFNQGSAINFTFEDSHFVNDTDYYILGETTNGSLSMFISPNGIYAEINVDSVDFIVNPISQTNGILIRIDRSSTDSSECNSNIITDDPGDPGDPTCIHGDCGNDVLDLLVMITPEADSWLNQTFGNFKSVMLSSWANNINVAFRKSKILNKRVRVSYVSFTPTEEYGNDPDNDIGLIGSDQEAIDLLNDYGADIGILLLNSSMYGQVLGSSNGYLQPNKFCILQIQSIQGNYYTIAHEIGHNFGCGHQLEGGNGCASAKILSNGKNTIMCTLQQPYSQIPHYSEPTVSYNGEATGTTDITENANKIRITFCNVASSNEVDPFYVDFTVESENYYNCPLECTANILSGYQHVQGNNVLCSTPYTYVWSMSPFLSNSWTIIGSNSPNLTITTRIPKITNLKLEVYSNNGCYSVYQKTIIRPLSGTCERNRISEHKDSRKYFAYPNPASNYLSINYLVQTKINKIIASSIDNKESKILDKFYFENNLLTLDISDLTSGLWIISVYENNLVRYYKVITD
ncbi:MAG: M12 family metallo-peptidase [Saprospiraceae bacterium]